MPIRCRLFGDDGDVIARFDVSDDSPLGDGGAYAERNLFCAGILDDPLFDAFELDDRGPPRE
jgi:hypothetical protein